MKTFEELIKMEARELDVLAAESRGQEVERWPLPTSYSICEHGYSYRGLPNYSTDATAAMELADEMPQLDIYFFKDDERTALDFREERYDEMGIAIKGKPSKSFARAITIAYILFKQSPPLQPPKLK